MTTITPDDWRRTLKAARAWRNDVVDRIHSKLSITQFTSKSAEFSYKIMKNLNEYQVAALRTAPNPNAAEEDLMHAAAGVCTEGGELMDVFKKFHFYNKPIDWVNVQEEIGDVLWYLALACRASGTTLEIVAEKNIAKLKARYPDKFSNQRAVSRDLDAERKILEENTVQEMD